MTPFPVTLIAPGVGPDAGLTFTPGTAADGSGTIAARGTQRYERIICNFRPAQFEELARAILGWTEIELEMAQAIVQAHRDGEAARAAESAQS